MKLGDLFILTALALAVFSCGRNSQEPAVITPPLVEPVDTLPTNPVVTVPLRDLPPDPGSAGKATLAGIDSDFNGLRDDLQIFIDTAYTDPALRKGAVQLAKSLQSLMVRSTEIWSVQASTYSMNRAIDCLYALNPDKFGDHVSDIEGLAVNTTSRSRAYARAGASISGGNYAVSTVGDNASSCEANP